MEMLSQKQKIIVIVFIIIATFVVAVYYINSTKEIYSYDEINISVENTEDKNEEKTAKNIIIHIAGAVKNNGIVEVKENARINDVVEAAGGLAENADLNQVNLAYVVEDGQKIYIPHIDEFKEETEEIIQENAGNKVTEEKKTEKININKASLQEMTELPGVGEAIASKIIEYRNSNGNFNQLEDIKNVSGIGDAKYDSIKDFITI